MDNSEIVTPSDQNSTSCDVIFQCRSLITDGCSTLLQDMFSDIEATFLELADNIPHQEEKVAARSACMAAAATIGEQEAEIIGHFQQQITLGFQVFCRQDESIDQDFEGDITRTYGAEIENDITIRKMAFECRNLYFKQLYELRHRMALVHGGKKIEEKELPGGPTHIISSFHAAIAPLDLNRNIRTSLYSLFNDHVMAELGTTYERYNNLLIEAGLFPNLKPISARPPSEEADLQPPADTASQAQPAAGEQIVETETESNQEEITAELIGILNQIQPITSTSIDALATTPDSASMAEKIDKQITQDLHKHLIAENRRLLESIDRTRLTKVQASAIKLVMWIFEDIIDTPLLPGAVKALLCNLHIPYLKITLLDQGFFNQNDHPARELLNLMIRSGGQWVDEFNLQKGAYPKLSEITDRILFEFSDNIELFDELLAEYREHMQQLQHKAEAVEHRAQESARGRDKLDSTRQQVAETIQAHTQDRMLPTPISQFLQGAWSDKLTLMLLRNPEAVDSPEWREAIEIIDSLAGLDSESPAETRQDIGERIKQNMSLLGDYQSHDVDALCLFLAGQETEAAQGEAGEAQDEGRTATPPLSEKEKEILEKVLKIEPGTWFEMTSSDNNKIHRVKLSWRSGTSSNHMFIDQSGAQALTLTAEELARALNAGTAHILGHHRIPFVDRAIKNIGDRLKEPEQTLEKQLSSGE